MFSADRKFYLDTWERVDLAPVVQLRRTSDLSVMMEVEKGDVSALLAAGFSLPEVFVAKGRDGATDIWGMIVRPTNFDPARKYPVIEDIYAGPQGSFVPKTFSSSARNQGLADLGFILVQIDGMGTSNRSKAFHDVAWKNLGDAGLPDRILCTRPWRRNIPITTFRASGFSGTRRAARARWGHCCFIPSSTKSR